jgi:hypothetical protein
MSTLSDVFVAGLEQVRKSWMKHLSRLLMLAFALSVTIGSAFAQPCLNLSDQILIGDTGPRNSLEIHFFTEPNLLPIVNRRVVFEGVTYFNSGLVLPCEDLHTGIQFTFPPLSGTSITFTIASDGLGPITFNIPGVISVPDVTDGIHFNGAPQPDEPTGWVRAGSDTWVIPANTGSPTGDFDFPGVHLTTQFANFVPVFDSPIPEPSSFLLLASGLAGLTGVARRRLF